MDEPDPEALGVKGLGEIRMVGTAAAVANAIYHATGKRVRSLAVTIDKLLKTLGGRSRPRKPAAAKGMLGVFAPGNGMVKSRST